MHNRFLIQQQENFTFHQEPKLSKRETLKTSTTQMTTYLNKNPNKKSKQHSKTLRQRNPFKKHWHNSYELYYDQISTNSIVELSTKQKKNCKIATNS